MKWIKPASGKKSPLPWEPILFCGLLLAMALSPLADFGIRSAQVRGEVLRLHILANSDSPQDQALKLQVRDAILEEMGPQLGAAADLEEAQALAGENLDRVEAIARRTLDAAGCSLPVKAQLVEMYFNTRSYGSVTLPAGEYQALRVTIGEAQGQNWWCVMFPPLCIPAAAQENGAEETQQILLLDQEPNYQLAFWSVEVVEGLLEQWRQGT